MKINLEKNRLIHFNGLCLPFILLLGLTACDSAAFTDTFTSEDADEIDLDHNDYTGPVDHGLLSEPVEAAAARVANPQFHYRGSWSIAGNWPISPIHLSLLPDGRVLSYGTNGTDTAEDRGAAFTFDLWEPGSFNRDRHRLLPTKIATNLFCSAQTILPDGNVLFSGGDRSSINDKTFKLDGVNDTTHFDVNASRLSAAKSMNAPRWYPTLVTLPDGRQLVLGGKDHNVRQGRQVIDKVIPAFPEIYDPVADTWTILSGATNAEFFDRNWFYPRAFLKSDGKIAIIDRVNRNGFDDVYELSVAGSGSLSRIGSIPANFARQSSPAVMFAMDKILLLSQTGETLVVDVSDSSVNYEIQSPAGTHRIWGNTTILPNGDVFLSGGRGAAKTPEQKLNQAVYKGQIWSPVTGRWTDTASAAKARLYHSTAMLLPSGRVLIAGGGPPGPVVNKNAERFQPPYLFSPQGTLAERPAIDSVGTVRRAQKFNVILKKDETIDRVTLIRAGSDTHSFDQGQRFLELNFSQDSPQVLEVSAPANHRLAPPGLYLLFVLNSNGVPSTGQLIMI